MPKIVAHPNELLVSTRISEPLQRMVSFAAARKGNKLSAYVRHALEAAAARDLAAMATPAVLSPVTISEPTDKP